MQVTIILLFIAFTASLCLIVFAAWQGFGLYAGLMAVGFSGLIIVNLITYAINRIAGDAAAKEAQARANVLTK